jgi:tetratricopeptide (TPR) repeat protein
MMRGLVVVATLWSAVAFAQTTDEEAAKRHYLSGQAYFNNARYEEALHEFIESYKLSHREAIAYNIGICQEKLDRVDEAIESLERYLAHEPNSPRRESVNELLDGLRVRQKQKAAAATPENAAPPTGDKPPPDNPANVVATSPPPRHRLRPAAIAVAGVAVAALLAGAGAYGVASRDYGDLYSTTCVSHLCTPNDWSGAQTAANAGYGLFAAAGAAAAADVVLWILQVKY